MVFDVVRVFVAMAPLGANHGDSACLHPIPAHRYVIAADTEELRNEWEACFDLSDAAGKI